MVRTLVLLSMAVCVAAYLLLAARPRLSGGAVRRRPRPGAAPVAGAAPNPQPTPAILGASVAAAAPVAVGAPASGAPTAALTPSPDRNRRGSTNSGASHFTATPRDANPVRSARVGR